MKKLAPSKEGVKAVKASSIFHHPISDASPLKSVFFAFGSKFLDYQMPDIHKNLQNVTSILCSVKISAPGKSPQKTVPSFDNQQVSLGKAKSDDLPEDVEPEADTNRPLNRVTLW